MDCASHACAFPSAIGRMIAHNVGTALIAPQYNLSADVPFLKNIRPAAHRIGYVLVKFLRIFKFVNMFGKYIHPAAKLKLRLK